MEGDCPKAIDGYYPLYDTISGANANGNGTHPHVLGEVTYYMPNGLAEQWHGTYNDLVFIIVTQPAHGASILMTPLSTPTPNLSPQGH